MELKLNFIVFIQFPMSFEWFYRIMSNSKRILQDFDNVSASYMSSNPIHHQWTKHIEIDLHFVGEKVSIGEEKVLHVPSSRQFADIFTKGLPSSLLDEFHCSLNIRPRPGWGGLLATVLAHLYVTVCIDWFCCKLTACSNSRTTTHAPT
jgi:hypothetical protein